MRLCSLRREECVCVRVCVLVLLIVCERHTDRSGVCVCVCVPRTACSPSRWWIINMESVTTEEVCFCNKPRTVRNKLFDLQTHCFRQRSTLLNCITQITLNPVHVKHFWKVYSSSGVCWFFILFTWQMRKTTEILKLCYLLTAVRFVRSKKTFSLIWVQTKLLALYPGLVKNIRSAVSPVN